MPLIKQYAGFLKRANLRNKILIPFLLIIVLLGIGFLGISFYFISQSNEKQISYQLNYQNLITQNALNNAIQKNETYVNLVAALTSSMQTISRYHRVSPHDLPIPPDTPDRKLYTQLSEVPLSKQPIFKQLTATASETSVLGVYPKPDSIDLAVSVFSKPAVSPTASSTEVIVAELPLTDNFAYRLRARYALDFSLIYYGNVSDNISVAHVLSSPFITENKAFREQLAKQVRLAVEKKSKFPVMAQLTFEGTPYRYLINTTAQDTIYQLVVFPVKELLITKIRLLIWTIVTLVSMGALVYAIFSIIIRKITSSLDILSAVATKVARGDLNQRVYVEGADEVGALSSIFNQMIQSLKESAVKLTHEKNKSEAIISCIPEGIIVTDMDNRLVLANQLAEQMFNFSQDKIQGKFLLEYITNEDLISVLSEEVQGEQKQIKRELVIPEKNEKDHIYTLTSSMVKDNKGKAIGVITILRDITRDRELEELREGFLRTVSHELRTPLTSVIGFIELTYRGAGSGISDQHKEFLKIALKEASSLKNLIDDLLDLSRIKAGKMKMHYTEVNINELLEGLVESYTPLAQAKNLELRKEFNNPKLTVNADLPKLRRILVNLISNAIKFTLEGSIVLKCHNLGDELEFSVHDTGIGLLEDERDVIFEKFRQVDYSSTRKYEGIGLGLSIVKQLVELHKGRVWVESEYKKGSIFRFTIPKTTINIA